MTELVSPCKSGGMKTFLVVLGVLGIFSTGFVFASSEKSICTVTLSPSLSSLENVGFSPLERWPGWYERNDLVFYTPDGKVFQLYCNNLSCQFGPVTDLYRDPTSTFEKPVFQMLNTDSAQVK